MNEQLHVQPTIKDVARAANVSHSTVSYILNNSQAAQRISAATKERVWSAIERLGYKSNPIGRALQRGYSHQVTLLIVTWNLATSHSATAMAISRAATQFGLALTVHVADSDADAEAFIKRSMLHHAGGILVLWDSPAFQQSSLCKLAAEGVPVIDLLPGSPPEISVVTADRENAGFQAAQHLIGLGHQRIGFVGDMATRSKTTKKKLAGFKRAFDMAEIVCKKTWIEDVDEFGFEGGFSGFKRLARRAPEITALFCINDSIALGAIAAAEQLGRRCPHDLSVVGFGDSREAAYWKPKLTTFALSSKRVAEEALKLILAQRQSPLSQPKTLLVEEALIVRESTACATKSPSEEQFLDKKPAPNHSASSP
jgi:DNA-binding LacI/PurR family transcriptional regulator